jgi:hypothetical protein
MGITATSLWRDTLRFEDRDDGVRREDSNEVLQLACDARVKVPSDPCGMKSKSKSCELQKSDQSI